MAKRQSGSNRGQRIGSWSFLIGVVLAVVLGLFGPVTGGWLVTLVVLGLIVGFLNITEEETQPFLLAGVVLIIAANFGQEVMQVVTIFGYILSALLAIFVPATILVAIKHVFGMAKSR